MFFFSFKSSVWKNFPYQKITYTYLNDIQKISEMGKNSYTGKFSHTLKNPQRYEIFFPHTFKGIKKHTGHDCSEQRELATTPSSRPAAADTMLGCYLWCWFEFGTVVEAAGTVQVPPGRPYRFIRKVIYFFLWYFQRRYPTSRTVSCRPGFEDGGRKQSSLQLLTPAQIPQ